MTKVTKKYTTSNKRIRKVYFQPDVILDVTPNKVTVYEDVIRVGVFEYDDGSYSVRIVNYVNSQLVIHQLIDIKTLNIKENDVVTNYPLMRFKGNEANLKESNDKVIRLRK